MKLQLKRSNVLLDGAAKPPTEAQMEYGELAVNYNASDPVVFIKNSNNQIIRLTNSSIDWDNIENKPELTIGAGAINIEVGDGLTASGDNANANQSVDTTRTISLNPKTDGSIEISVDGIGVKVAPGYGIENSAEGLRFGDSWANIPSLPTAS